MKIFKYPIEIVDYQQLTIKGLIKTLHAGLDPNGSPCLWCLVNVDDPDSYKLDVHVIGTGNLLPEDEGLIQHQGSFIQSPFVWHVFTKNLY